MINDEKNLFFIYKKREKKILPLQQQRDILAAVTIAAITATAVAAATAEKKLNDSIPFSLSSKFRSIRHNCHFFLSNFN